MTTASDLMNQQFQGNNIISFITICSSTNRPSNPIEGLLIYETDTNKVQKNIGTPSTPSWRDLETKGYEDIQDYGAKVDGVTNDNAAINLALIAANESKKPVLIPQNTVWNMAGITLPDDVKIIDLSSNWLYFWDYAAQPGKSSSYIRRNADYEGGTPGFVSSALLVKTEVGVDVTDFEWGLLSVLNNHATAGENVGFYSQANKYSSGPTWGACIEARNKTNAPDVGGLVGLELDIMANGADPSSRVGIDIVVGRDNNTGERCEVSYGIRFSALNNDPTNEGFFRNGILFQGEMTTAINVTTTGTWGVKIAGTTQVGLELSTASHPTAAIRIKENDVISLAADGKPQMKFNSTSGNIEFYYDGVLVGHIVAVGGSDHAL